MTMEERLRLWIASKQAIAGCRECFSRWPSHVEPALFPDEIPNPVGNINILFVGVAPPPSRADGDDDVGHFYSNPRDRLRVGIFHVLDQVFETDLTESNRDSRESGTTAFLNAGFFFVHAAKVRPCRGRLAPSRKIMRFCAKQHLADEILLLRPKSICFVGATSATPAAEAVFQRSIGETAEQCEIRGKAGMADWRGWVAVTVQPVRGTMEGRNRERTAKVIGQLRQLIADQSSHYVGPEKC